MSTFTDCLLHPIDCARAATGEGIRPDTREANERWLATLPADDPRRAEIARVEAERAAHPGFFDNIATTAEAGRDSVMWTAIAVGAAVIGVIVVMLTIVHFTNRI